jgi:hypothetical protein
LYSFDSKLILLTSFSDWVKSRIIRYPVGANVVISDILLDVYSFLLDSGEVRQEVETYVYSRFISHVNVK